MNLVVKISAQHTDVIKYVKRLLQVDDGEGPQVFTEGASGLSFLSGLIPYVNSNLAEDGFDFQIPFTREMDMSFQAEDVVSVFADFEERDADFDGGREYQHQAALKCLRMKRGMCALPTGSGKCLGGGTPVLMYDGSVRLVEDIKVGDQLMGDDSTPRNVLSVCSGESNLFLVKQKNGDDYIVNDAHILSLKKTPEMKNDKNAYRVVDISVSDYLKSNSTFRHTHKGYKAPVSFAGKVVPFDPYFLGLWLGDGYERDLQISVGDKDFSVLSEYLEGFCRDNNLHCVKYKNYGKGCSTIAIRKWFGQYLSWQKEGKNHLKSIFRELDLFYNKHVPDVFKFNSEEVLLGVLAGFIDADGHCDVDQDLCTIIHRPGRLMDDVCFIARSLGFRVTSKLISKKCTTTGFVGGYVRLLISGNVSRIPTKLLRKQVNERKINKKPLVYGIEVVPAGFGQYFGFQLDGNKRFLLGDFTVTHNTDTAACIVRILSNRDKKILILNDRVEILRQTRKRYVLRGIPSDSIALFGDGDSNAQITLCSISSVYGALKDKDPATKKLIEEADVLLFDEAHHIGAASWLAICKRAKKAEYLLGFSGSCYWDRRNPYSNYRDLVTTGITGGIICSISSPFLREQGYLATPFIHLLEYDKDGLFPSRDWHFIQNKFIVNNTSRNDAAIRIVAYLDRLGLKTLVLVTIIEHGHLLLKLCADRGIKAVFNSGGDTLAVWDKENSVVKIMKGDLTLVKQLLNSGINVVIGSTVYDEGVDIPGIDVGVFLSGGKSPVKLLQRVGRIVRRKRGINKALLFDMFDGGANHTLRTHRQKRLLEYEWEQIPRIDLTQALELANEIARGKQNVG